ncbi:RES family NAD+ phosphorylase [Larkinella soli]|uniref:RES family NAD+ phosphorylase n=1 Tax=Larkinella soli TaxID=1770527 RepID=UPI000FFC33CD|nr:RES family NAD+ phosphorylase [Larkinella soli]
MLVYRLLQAAYRHEPLSGKGAALYGGRWNPKGISLLYTTESPALSLLEVLVHLNPKHIPEYDLATIEIPDSVRTYGIDELPSGWQNTGTVQPTPSQTFLLDWLRTPNCLTVKIPSAVLPLMANYLINPRHPQFSNCKVVSIERFMIDERLYDPTRR